MHNGEGSDNILMVSSAGYSGFGSRVFTYLNPASMEMTVDTSKIRDRIFLERMKVAEEFVMPDVDLWRPSWGLIYDGRGYCTAVAVVREELKSETTLNELFNAD